MCERSLGFVGGVLQGSWTAMYVRKKRKLSNDDGTQIVRDHQPRWLIARGGEGYSFIHVRTLCTNIHSILDQYTRKARIRTLLAIAS